MVEPCLSLQAAACSHSLSYRVNLETLYHRPPETGAVTAGEVVGFLFLHSFASEMNHCVFYYLMTSSTLSAGDILE